MTVLLYHREIIDATHWVANWDYSSSEWFYFYQTNLSHVKYRLIMCSVEIMGIIIATRLWFREHRWLWSIVTVLLSASILLSGSRQALVSLILITVIALGFLLSQHLKWYYTASILAATLLTGGLLLSLHPRFHAMDIHSEERVQIWKAALQHSTEYVWKGFGGGQDGVQLMRTHSHNQYLQELREGGIIGLAFFLLAWAAVPLCAPKKQKKLAVLFTVMFACNMCTECMFAKYCGVALWSVGLIFVLLQSDTAGQQQSARRTET